MKKFAFLVHVRNSYRTDLAAVARPFGWLPESFYETAMRNRPVRPFVWSEVTLSPDARQAEGYVIMVPYSGKQLLTQQRAMMPRIEQAVSLAGSLGAEVIGLGALTSPVTLGGKLLTNHKEVSVTNGNAFTAVITWHKVVQLIQEHKNYSPTVAIVGATGSVGHLVSLLLAKHQPNASYMLIARNERRLKSLATEMTDINPFVRAEVFTDMDAIRQADIVVLMTSASEALLQSKHLKIGATVLDDTIPRNTNPMLLKQRPDVTIIDGGLVSMPYIHISRDIGLPDQTSYACLAETMLLSLAGHEGHFSIGNPTLDQAEYISDLALKFSDYGFCPAADHSFRAPLKKQSRFTTNFSKELAPAF